MHSQELNGYSVWNHFGTIQLLDSRQNVVVEEVSAIIYTHSE